MIKITVSKENKAALEQELWMHVTNIKQFVYLKFLSVVQN